MSPDPFDTSQFWPKTESQRPNYSIQIDDSQYQSQNSSATTSTEANIYNNMTLNNASQYGTLPNNAISNNTLSRQTESINESINSLADMSLDDRISESLNLRSKNTNESMYANSNTYEVASTSNYQPTETYNDFPIYSNFDMNASQQQFILETKDYYTKFSKPSGSQSTNDYEKNMYKPKFEEKLKNFSECRENSKNYSALKYQNVDYSSSVYDEVNEASNVYSEIDAQYAGVGAACVYDEVYEPAPRPHRPAPPCPFRPK